MKINGEFGFSAGTARFLGKDVIIIEYTNERLIQEEDVISVSNLRKKHLGNIPFYTVTDIRKGFVRFSQEAKLWAAENMESAKFRKLDVLLISNWVVKLEVKHT